MPEKVSELVAQTRKELRKAVVGQQAALDQILCVILSGGHALVEGAPGLAKTLAVKVLALILRLGFQRIQCTPDLMPADMVGANVLNMATGTFAFHQGPIFTELLLVDEINRTPPRTQAALLEAMEERQVTVDGTRRRLSEFFIVLATQNPIEFEGTYPLPEAQLDRFLMKIRMNYPAVDEETQILQAHHEGFVPQELERLKLTPIEKETLLTARREVSSVRVEAGLLGYVAAVARRTRDWPSVNLGASPRAAVNLLMVAKALAAMDGRDYLIPDDVKTAAPPVLRHRLVLKPEADLEGLTADQVVADVLAAVEVPK